MAQYSKQYSKQLSNRKNVGSGENGQVYSVPAGKQWTVLSLSQTVGAFGMITWVNCWQK